MNILVKYEGGIGDCLLANRFLFAIKEKHPDSNIEVAFDTNGNPNQESILKRLWPSIYTNTFTIGKRLSDSYFIENKSGRVVNYPPHPNNLPASFNNKLKNCDRYYNLHIDSLNFMKYDFNWLSWYYHFPKPENYSVYNGKLPDKFIMVHLLPRMDSFHKLDREYSIQLIKQLQKVLPVVVICDEENFGWYNNVSDYIIDPTFSEIFDIASKCSMFFGADSSVRYIPLHFGKPTYILSHHCTKPNDIKSVNHAHLLRWLVFRNNVLPSNCNIERIELLAKNVLSNPAYVLFSEFSSGLETAIQDIYNL
jgi:hypothetical protein